MALCLDPELVSLLNSSGKPACSQVGGLRSFRELVTETEVLCVREVTGGHPALIIKSTLQHTSHEMEFTPWSVTKGVLLRAHPLPC